ncbi:hypothetical protein ACLB1G_07885 [Oxalobacteraceae bacterium A2-2]
MDQPKLRALVFERTGVRIDVDDPVFALVALNEAVLEEAVERHIARIDAASEAAAARLAAAGAHAAHDPGAHTAPPLPYHPAPATPVQAIPTRSPAFAPRELRLLGAAAAISLLSALLVLGGQALLRQSAPVPATPARELSPDQVQALRQAEKLNKAIDKLDPKTRAALETELRK